MRDEDRAWAALDAELSEWARAGRAASLWWRDDDAMTDSAALTHLLSLTGEYGVPLSLAVVPQKAGASNHSLVKAAGDAPLVTPIVHGYAHVNHAPPGEKQAEFGGHRPLALMRAELARGLALLSEMFGARLCKVLAPPWNRMDDGLAAVLPQLGFIGITAFRPAANRMPAPGLVQTNCHIDPIDWHGARGLRPVQEVLDDLIALLRARRLYPALPERILLSGKPIPAGFDPDEPTGILTHHHAHDSAGWGFLNQLLNALGPHCKTGGARWLSCAEAFKAPGGAR